MILHHDREAFEELVAGAANELKIPAPIIEKDYFVTLALKELSKNAPDCSEVCFFMCTNCKIACKRLHLTLESDIIKKNKVRSDPHGKHNSRLCKD